MNSLSILVIANVIGCCKALQSKFQRIPCEACHCLRFGGTTVSAQRGRFHHSLKLWYRVALMALSDVSVSRGRY